jgi:hypothetical protein
MMKSKFFVAFTKKSKSSMVNKRKTSFVASHDPPSFAQWRPASPGHFHQISIDEFTLLVDVASFGFRPMIIGMVAIVSGCRPRFK